jgi:hypothetical protein
VRHQDFQTTYTMVHSIRFAGSARRFQDRSLIEWFGPEKCPCRPLKTRTYIEQKEGARARGQPSRNRGGHSGSRYHQHPTDRRRTQQPCGAHAAWWRVATDDRRAAIGAPEPVGACQRATLFSLCCRFDAHNRVTAGRGTGRKFPTFERPQAKLPPFEKRLRAHVPSGPSPPSRNAHPHSHRNL